LGGDHPLRLIGIIGGTYRAERIQFAAARGERIH
jgi:hypothetical protein